jgi:hypothetical protein
MGQITMQIKRRAEADPKVNAQHDGQVVGVKTGPDSRDPKELQNHEDRKNGDIKLFVFEHRRA